METLSIRLNTTKPWASRGVARHVEGRLHSTLSAHVQQHPPFCLHLPWSSVFLPIPSQLPFLQLTFPFPSNSFSLPFSLYSLLLFRQLAACSCLLAMSPVNPKVSLHLLSRETFFHGKNQKTAAVVHLHQLQRGKRSGFTVRTSCPLSTSASFSEIRFPNILPDTHMTPSCHPSGAPSYKYMNRQGSLQVPAR